MRAFLPVTKNKIRTILRIGLQHDHDSLVLGDLTMQCFVCTLLSDTIQLNEHAADAWLDAESLHTVKWLPADEGLIPKIGKLLCFFD